MPRAPGLRGLLPLAAALGESQPDAHSFIYALNICSHHIAPQPSP
jgi:hypothetical protein